MVPGLREKEESLQRERDFFFSYIERKMFSQCLGV
jgi:hypothetical protein